MPHGDCEDVLRVGTLGCQILKCNNVYANIFAYSYFRGLGLNLKFASAYFRDFSGAFISVNGHEPEWKFSR